MELFWWVTTLALMTLGLVGTILPFVPGTTIILAAALLHRCALGSAKSVGWPVFALLIFLTLLSYAIDLLGGWLGARRFGATRWGMSGACAGALVGLFFGPAGLLLGPIIGTFAGEILGGKRLVDAGRASWGALLGNLAATCGKLLIAAAMIAVFLFAAPSPF